MRPAPTFKLPKGALTLRRPLAVPEAGAPRRRRTRRSSPPGKKAVLALDGKPYRGKLELVPQGAVPPRRERRPLESYLQGVVAGEVRSAGRPRCSRHRRRGPLVCAGEPREGEAVRPLPGRAQPGLPRRVRGEAVHDEGRYGHGRRGRALRREGRDDVLLLDVGRKDRQRRRRLRLRGPYLQSRPDPWDKASPYHRWGPVSSARGPCRRSSAARRASSTRRDGDTVRTASLLVLSTTAGSETVPGLARPNGARPRSTWITVGVIRLDRPSVGTVTLGSSAR